MREMSPGWAQTVAGQGFAGSEGQAHSDDKLEKFEIRLEGVFGGHKKTLR